MANFAVGHFKNILDYLGTHIRKNYITSANTYKLFVDADDQTQGPMHVKHMFYRASSI